MQESGNKACIKQIPFHRSKAIGGVGLLSCLMRSNSCCICSQLRSLQEPARARVSSMAFCWGVSDDGDLPESE